MHDLDLAILDLVQSVHAGWLDVASSIVGLFGQTEVTLGIALGIAVARWRRDPRSAVIPLFIVLTILAEAALKIVIPQAPPPAERSRAVELIPFVHAPFAYSFPSGHVARASFLLATDRGIPLVIVVIGIALMALTRIYLGEHWFTDTVGGVLLGLAVAALARRATWRPSGRLRP